MKYKELQHPRGFAERVDEIIDSQRAVNNLFQNATDNEAIVLQGLLMGKTQEEISKYMGLSPQRISQVVVRLRDKYSDINL